MKLEGTDFTLGDVLEDNAAYTRYYVTYKSNGLLISGILNIPKGDGPFPLLLLNHGYIDPAVYTNGRGLKREQDSFARAGFAVLHSDYRGHAFSDESPDKERRMYDAGLEYSMDVINGLKAIKAAKIPKIDTEHVGMLGHSMGGGVSMNIATAYPELIDAVILYAPVNGDAWENFNRWKRERDTDDRTALVMGERVDNPAMWDALSSETYFKNIKVPVLLFQGTNDKDVPFEWSDELADDLSNLKKDITYVKYQSEGHEFATKFTDFMRRSQNFYRAAFNTSSKDLLDASRVTLKPFGIKIEKATSPVQPERFAGFHTGADFELLEGENPNAINVRAICTGEILLAGIIDGYGGVVSQKCTIDGQAVTVVYGHLAASSFIVQKGMSVQKNQVLGTLGKGFTSETDNERPHLHLGIHKGSTQELRGYVQYESELSEWMDPMNFVSSL